MRNQCTHIHACMREHTHTHTHTHTRTHTRTHAHRYSWLAPLESDACGHAMQWRNNQAQG